MRVAPGQGVLVGCLVGLLVFSALVHAELDSRQAEGSAHDGSTESGRQATVKNIPVALDEAGVRTGTTEGGDAGNMVSAAAAELALKAALHMQREKKAKSRERRAAESMVQNSGVTSDSATQAAAVDILTHALKQGGGAALGIELDESPPVAAASPEVPARIASEAADVARYFKRASPAPQQYGPYPPAAYGAYPPPPVYYAPPMVSLAESPSSLRGVEGRIEDDLVRRLAPLLGGRGRESRSFGYEDEYFPLQGRRGRESRSFGYDDEDLSEEVDPGTREEPMARRMPEGKGEVASPKLGEVGQLGYHASAGPDRVEERGNRRAGVVPMEPSKHRVTQANSEEGSTDESEMGDRATQPAELPDDATSLLHPNNPWG